MRRSETRQACKDMLPAQVLASSGAPQTSLGKRKWVCPGRSSRESCSSCDSSGVEGEGDRFFDPSHRTSTTLATPSTGGQGRDSQSLNRLPWWAGPPRGGATVGGREKRKRSGHVRLVAFGHVTGDGAQATQAGSSPEGKPSEVGDPEAVTMVSARRLARAVSRGASVRAAGAQRRARRRAWQGRGAER